MAHVGDVGDPGETVPRAAAAWGMGRVENVAVDGQRNSKGTAVSDSYGLHAGRLPNRCGLVTLREAGLPCVAPHIPSHDHPPDMVTYSPDNPSATKYHCPDLPCGAKPENTPYHMDYHERRESPPATIHSLPQVL